MSSEVKRYTRCGMSIDEDKKGGWVEYSDYAALEAECERLKNSLLEVTTRHFAEGWKRSASEKQLEQYLSAGIAQLETERDAALSQLAAIQCGMEEAVVVGYRWVQVGDELNGYEQSVRLTQNKPSNMAARLGYEPVMTVAQHQRVTAAMAAELADAKSARDAYGQNAIDMQKQRDALAAENEALAKLAELTEVQRLREALEFTCKSLAQMTSADGSGHADIALSVLRMVGVGSDERERLVEGWKSRCQWRIDAASTGQEKE